MSKLLSTNSPKIKVIAIVGPTASGKTSYSIELAKKLGGEIISADSRYVYKGFDIATAKPSISEQDGIPHHMIDIVEPEYEYSVGLYKTEAEKIIKSVADTVSIPVIGNGDITCGKDAKKMFDYTGCTGVMIGRAAEGNPWVFREVLHYLKHGETLPPPDFTERVTVAMCHLDLLIKLKGERRGVLEGRKHMAWYFKGVSGGAILRECINKANTADDMRRIIVEFAKRQKGI